MKHSRPASPFFPGFSKAGSKNVSPGERKIMSDTRSDLASQRRKLLIATTGVGAVAAAATAVPFVASLTPSERARAAGAPVEADVSKLAPGEMATVEWRGKPVWILRRTPEMLASLESNEQRLVDAASGEPQQPDYAVNRHRSINPEYLVVIGICTHLGCSPSEKFAPGTREGMTEDWPGGFLCPCHGSIFDLAGRVYLSQPAPTNLEIPPHKWLSAGVLVIGEDDQGTA
jgi:ubiquinol-cytochrome c reductase iron-sulfur subunit